MTKLAPSTFGGLESCVASAAPAKYDSDTAHAFYTARTPKRRLVRHASLAGQLMENGGTLL